VLVVAEFQRRRRATAATANKGSIGFVEMLGQAPEVVPSQDDTKVAYWHQLAIDWVVATSASNWVTWALI
jgi:hypothetical protein